MGIDRGTPERNLMWIPRRAYFGLNAEFAETRKGRGIPQNGRGFAIQYLANPPRGNAECARITHLNRNTPP